MDSEAPMDDRKAKLRALRQGEPGDFAGQRLGRIVSVDEEGRAHVVFPGSHDVAVRARSLLDAPAPAGVHPEDLVGAGVLLLFEDEDPNQPIIVGLVRDALLPEARRPEVELDLARSSEAGEERDVVIDGERLIFDANREILLRCGASSILLRRDGKVVVRGKNVISRAKVSNRIRGGSIRLN
jgi:hypothetical protein